MTKRNYTKFIRYGDYIAEAKVELIYSDQSWSPYLSLEDALKLDEIREALRQGNIEIASKMAPIYKLDPVKV